MANKIYLDDIGLTFRVSTGTDLTAATKTMLLVQLPDKTEAEWIASAPVPASGILEYITTEAFPVAGQYALQAYVEFPDGQYYGNTASFRVYREYQ